MAEQQAGGVVAASERASAQVIRGRLVLPDRVLAGDLIVEGGLIASIEPRPAAAEGPWVLPGFVDVHVHGWGGHDAMGPDGSLDDMARALARRGVTSFLPTAVTAPLSTLGDFATRVRAWIPRAPADGAEPLGFNLEGPFLDVKRKGAQNAAHIRAPADAAPGELEPLLEGLRVITIAPEIPGALDLIAMLAGRGVVVSLGHSGATYDEAREGYRAGARSTTHLFNAMSGVDHRSPGLAVAALAEPDAWVELIADGQHVAPALWPLIVQLKGPERLLLVSDAVSLAGTGDGRGWLGGLEVEVAGERCTLVVGGSLAGSVIALDSAVRNMTRSGMGLVRAVAAASRKPAVLLGLEDRGALAVGLRADLVEMDDDLEVRRVMRSGRWLPG